MGLGEPDVRRLCTICRILYSMVIVLGFRGENLKLSPGREDLEFRGCRGGVGRGSRVGGRDWTWWNGKALEFIDFGVSLQRSIALCV